MKRTTVLVCAVTIALATVAPGSGAGVNNNDDEPKSVAAKAALRKYEKVAEKAQQAYARELDVARKAAAAELANAMKAATRAANLDEANRIKAAIDGLKGDPAGPPAKGAKAAGGGGGVGLGGKWNSVYIGPENRHVHEFREDGTVRNEFVGRAEWTAKLERDDDGNIIARFPDFLERYTLAGGRLFVEQFHPGRYPDQHPAYVAIGVRPEPARPAKRSR